MALAVWVCVTCLQESKGLRGEVETARVGVGDVTGLIDARFAA